jgi:hypothetical protein
LALLIIRDVVTLALRLKPSHQFHRFACRDVVTESRSRAANLKTRPHKIAVVNRVEETRRPFLVARKGVIDTARVIAIAAKLSTFGGSFPATSSQSIPVPHPLKEAGADNAYDQHHYNEHDDE